MMCSKERTLMIEFPEAAKMATMKMATLLGKVQTKAAAVRQARHAALPVVGSRRRKEAVAGYLPSSWHTMRKGRGLACLDSWTGKAVRRARARPITLSSRMRLGVECMY